MRSRLFAAAVILSITAFTGSSVLQAQENPPEGKVQLTQEHVQILQQIVQQMTPEQREALQQLPREQQQAIMLQLLARALPKPKEPIREWLNEDQDHSITFVDVERYPDSKQRIEDFVYKQTNRRVEVTSIAFLHDGHDHFFTYKRLFRAKYKTRKDDKEYMADFLLEKEGAYLKVKKWSRVEKES